MIEIPEGKLTLQFSDDEWSAVKFDDKGGFANRILIEKTKKVDVIALRRHPGRLLLIELKDFRGHAIENKHRVEGGAAVALEVAQKVRDSISVLVAAYRSKTGTELQAFCDFLFRSRDTQVEAILVLEEDTRRLDACRRSNIKTKLGTLLKCYGIHVKVVNREVVNSVPAGWSIR